VDTLRTDGGPAGLAISNDGKFLYVVNSFTSNVSVIDLKTKEEIKRLTVGNNPTGAQISPNGQKIYVTSRRANQVPYGDPVMSDLGVVNTESNRIAEQKSMESAYMMEKVAFTPSGDLALVTLIRPKNLVPSIQVERGWMMTNGIGIIEQKENGRIMQLLLDRPNSYFADPYDVVTSIDGKRAFVSSAGTNSISVIEMDSVRSLLKIATPALLHSWADNLDMSSRFVSKRISTGSNPKGLAVSPDGKFLYVAEMLEDKIRVISTESLETIGSIDLGGPRRITVARQGRRLFNNAGHTFQQQYSCYTCHPDHHEDGLVYNMASKDMGRNLTNTQSLRDIGDTPPFKWNGKNQTIYKQDGMRFSTVLTRTEAFSYNDLDAIAAYITRGIPNPPNLKYNPKGELTESQLRGKAIYERTHDNTGKEIPIGNRCITCHPPPFYTNLKMADVGTLAATDDTMKFDTPHLNNIFASPPYLHDGRAMTLEEIWTKNNPKDKHGVGNDMTKNQLNDLVDYLKSLRDPKYEENNSTKHDSHNSKKSNQS
jgi:YVTN family beta-propeller protein